MKKILDILKSLGLGIVTMILPTILICLIVCFCTHFPETVKWTFIGVVGIFVLTILYLLGETIRDIINEINLYEEKKK